MDDKKIEPKAIYKIIRSRNSIGALDNKMSVKDIISFLYVENFDDEKVEFVNITHKRRAEQKNNGGFEAAALRKNTLKFADLIMDFYLDCQLDERETELIFPGGNFLTYSTFIETVSSHLCSINGAVNCFHLFVRQNRYANLAQTKRIEKIREIILCSNKKMK